MLSLIILSQSSCTDSELLLSPGQYEAVFRLDSANCPVRLTINDTDSLQITFNNDSEQIAAIGITQIKDSLFFRLPIFNSEFKLKIQPNKTITGVWINHHKEINNTIPVEIHQTESVKSKQASKTTRWYSIFSPNTPDEYPAIALLKYNNTHISGTFQTETGDYRFLEGKITGKEFYLSCFDGSHLFYFTGHFANDSSITNGMFYSGKTWSEPWAAKLDSETKLKDPYHVTYLKSKNQPFTFSFPDTNNTQVSLTDTKFKNKPILVQIMGTWCPNCLDETKYLKEVYTKYNPLGLEIIALAFEARPDFIYAKKRITTLSNELQLPYPILIAGQSNKTLASNALPMLNQISSFPTTLLLDRNHQVVSIYTGFNGPSTGKAYQEYITETENTIKRLLQ